MIIQRTELKYIVPITIMKSLKERLSPFCIKDRYLKGEREDYWVHSIYYDTPNFCFYHEKLDGIELRKKFRIRFYGNEKGTPDGDGLWIELKQKFGPVIKKLRHPIDRNEYSKQLLEFPESTDHSLQKILFNYNLNLLRPVVNISYRRTPFSARFDDNTRITFDAEISGSSIVSDHLEKKEFPKASSNKVYLLSPFYFLLEIKVSDAMPSWVAHIIEEFNLELTAYSKYTEGIEHCGILNREIGQSSGA